MVSVHTLFADEQVYYPVEVEPYAPAHHFEKGKGDAAFRTKPEIAIELVEAAIAAEMPFRAVVADSFYGESESFRTGLLGLEEASYVLALGPSRVVAQRRHGRLGLRGGA